MRIKIKELQKEKLMKKNFAVKRRNKDGRIVENLQKTAFDIR